MISASQITESLTPADTAAVAEAVRNAGSRGMAVYPIGGGTQSGYGAAPSRPGIGVSLANLNRVIDDPADDLTITVEAGLTLAALDRCLAVRRQRLPVDVPRPKQATVGGAVAVNAAGPRRYGYGTIRDYVLGFTAVDGTGTVFSGGGSVVKNAAGYNMARLMSGSLGTLGILTQVTLMVRPPAEAAALLVCDLAQIEAAEPLLADLVRSDVRPIAIELLAGQLPDEDGLFGPPPKGDSPIFAADTAVAKKQIFPAAKGTGRRLVGTVPCERAARLCVGLEGSSEEVDWMVEELHRDWNAAGVGVTRQWTGPYGDPIWQQLTEMPGNAELSMEIHVLPSATVATLGKLLPLVPHGAIQARAGNGVIRIGLSCRAEDCRCVGEADAVGPTAVALIRQLREIAAAAGGKLVVAQHPDDTPLTAADIWGPPGPAVRVMQAVKDRFDPHNLLNPGRFIFP